MVHFILFTFSIEPHLTAIESYHNNKNKSIAYGKIFKIRSNKSILLTSNHIMHQVIANLKEPAFAPAVILGFYYIGHEFG